MWIARTGILAKIRILVNSLNTGLRNVWNFESLATTLDTSIYAVYNAENNANDSYGTNHGTAQGSLTYSTGKVGNAFEFNGSDAYVSLPDNSLNLTGDFTISFWVYHTASGSQTLFANTFYQTTPSNIYKGYSIGIDNLTATTNKLTFIIPRQTTDYLGWEFNTTLTLNTWNHVIVTRVSGVDTYAWINNVLSTTTYAGPISGSNKILDPTYHTTQRVAIGASNGTGTPAGYMKAGSRLDGLTIWNRQLTSNERTQLYNIGNGAEYQFATQTLPTPKDEIGGLDATLLNGCTFSSGKIGQALIFDGVNDYATFADDSLNLSGDFTISIWIYPVTGVAQNLLNNRAFTSGSINKGWGLGINNISGAQTSIITWTQGIGPLGSQYTGWEYRTTPLTLNAWNHVLIYRVSGVNTYCEVNSVLQSPTIFGTGANVTLDPTYHTTQKNSLGAFINLAGAVSNYTPANTKVDALTIWNRTLTTTEKNDLYNAGAGKQYLFT